MLYTTTRINFLLGVGLWPPLGPTEHVLAARVSCMLFENSMHSHIKTMLRTRVGTMVFSNRALRPSGKQISMFRKRWAT